MVSLVGGRLFDLGVTARPDEIRLCGHEAWDQRLAIAVGAPKHRVMHVVPHLPLEEIKRLERVEKDADRSKRMRIVILGREGRTAPAVAMAVGLSRRICQR